MSILDPHGQPDPLFNFPRRVERDVAEMLGLAKGVLVDGVVTEDEARFLYDWTAAHPDVVGGWPGKVLARRLRQVFRDGWVSDEERRDLTDLLTELTGGGIYMGGGAEPSTLLPFDDPLPEIEIPNRVFVLTGRFAYGTRDACQDALRSVGGWSEDNVTLDTNYLVIGTFASRDWIQSNWGRKIEKAVRYREENGWPRIITEEHWAAHL